MSNIVQSKKCNKCQQNKPVDEFHKCKRDGYQAQCKMCQKERIRASREAGSTVNLDYSRRNREVLRERAKKARESRAESFREKAREYRQRDVEKWRKYHREYKRNFSEDTKEKYRETERRRAARVPEKIAAKNSRRRARVLGASGQFTEQEFKELCEKHDNRCLACDKRRKMTVDHVIPLVKGGSNSIDNIQPLCLQCNDSKGTKEIDYR